MKQLSSRDILTDRQVQNCFFFYSFILAGFFCFFFVRDKHRPGCSLDLDWECFKNIGGEQFVQKNSRINPWPQYTRAHNMKHLVKDKKKESVKIVKQNALLSSTGETLCFYLIKQNLILQKSQGKNIVCRLICSTLSPPYTPDFATSDFLSFSFSTKWSEWQKKKNVEDQLKIFCRKLVELETS